MKRHFTRGCAFALLALLLWGCESLTESDAPHALAPEIASSSTSDVTVYRKHEGHAAATGGGHFTIPPEEFGAEVGNVLTFSAKNDNGNVSGRFDYQQTFMGERFHFNGPLTCFEVYDGNRAKIGALVQVSNDPTIPPGLFIWWSVIDNGQAENDPPDESTLIGVGDEEANEAFCNSPDLPRFGPWALEGGNFQVDG